jgi:hypothetical protein
VTTSACLVAQGRRPAILAAAAMDWDRVRVELVKAMRRHCSYRRWKYHPDTDGSFQKQTSFGFLARLSLRQTSGGCSGA